MTVRIENCTVLSQNILNQNENSCFCHKSFSKKLNHDQCGTDIILFYFHYYVNDETVKLICLLTTVISYRICILFFA